MDILVHPSKAQGSVSAPPSKSMAHRMLICAALAEGTSTIENISYSQDILATLDCIQAMGAVADIEGSTVTVKGIGDKAVIDKAVYECRESGSTLRFFIGIALAKCKEAVFHGSETLLGRPLSVYEDICKEQNITFNRDNGIYIKGQIKAGEYVLPGNISSQFISGLLFGLPLLEEDSYIRFNTNIESKSYIGLTLQALEEFGVTVVWNDEKTLYVKGQQQYVARKTVVEGDYSNAAFLDVYNTMEGNVKTLGLNENSLQGDKVYGEIFDRLCKENATVDISNCPDLGPVLFIVAALNNGATFTGTARLKIKESDRGTVMCQELAKFGVATEIYDDSIVIKKCDICKPSEAIDGHNDHRIVMSFTTLLSKTGGRLNGAQAVSKSYPDYFEVMKSLGIEVEEYGMD